MFEGRSIARLKSLWPRLGRGGPRMLSASPKSPVSLRTESFVQEGKAN